MTAFCWTPGPPCEGFKPTSLTSKLWMTLVSASKLKYTYIGARRSASFGFGKSLFLSVNSTVASRRTFHVPTGCLGSLIRPPWSAS